MRDKIYEIDSEIEFQHKNKEILGVITEIHLDKNKYQTRLYYEVITAANESFKVDGELYQTI